MPLKVVILGGTRGIGRAVARRLAERGDRVHLLGRDADELARCAADLQARTPGGAAVSTSLCDLERPESFEQAIAAAAAALDGFDTAVVTAGMFATQPQLEVDHAFTQRLLTVNFANTVLLCEHLRTYLLSRGGGTLCVFSSVAGDRGRKPVILYGAAKAGLSAYLEGLDHKFRVRPQDDLREAWIRANGHDRGIAGAAICRRPGPGCGDPPSRRSTAVRRWFMPRRSGRSSCWWFAGSRGW